MESLNIKDLDIKTHIHSNFKSDVYELSNGKILKIFTPLLLQLYENHDIKIERKIVEAKPIINVPEIIVPETAVYKGDEFCGYISKKANGVDYNVYDNGLTLTDRGNLKLYADNHAKLESIVKRGNEAGNVFPDLCTRDNIFIDENGNMSLIDYDGLQIGNCVTPVISTLLGNEHQYRCSKYSQQKLFTPELDKKSLIFLYFYNVFGIDLSKVGTINPVTNKVVTLDYAFEMIGLDDYDIQNKVWKCFQPKYENEFLGDDVYHMANYYDMIVVPLDNGIYGKKLIRK